MSLVITNGYRIGKKMEASEIREWVKPIREFVKVEVARFSYEELRNRSLKWMDFASVLSHDDLKDELSMADVPYEDDLTIQEFVRRGMIKESESPYRMDLDVECFLIAYPLEDSTLLFWKGGDIKVLTEFLEAMPEVEPYFYWNNTDKEEGVSEEAWKKRKEDWELALSPTWIPSDNGMVFYLNEHVSFVEEHDFKMTYPTVEERAKRIANRLVEVETAKEHRDDWNIVQFIEAISSDEFREKVKEKSLEVKSKLVKDVTDECFNRTTLHYLNK